MPPRLIDFFSDAPGLGGGLDGPAELDFGAVTIDFGTVVQDFHIGRGSAAVPGAFQGLSLAHERHGTRPLSALVAPACRLARDGHPASAETAMTFELLWDILAKDPQTIAAVAPQGRPPRVGELIGNPALANTLEAWAQVGGLPDEIARALVEEFGATAGGVITPEDIRHYRPTVLAPAETRIGELVVEVPPRVGGKLVSVILEALAARAPEAHEADEMVRYAHASAAGTRSREALIVPPDLPGSTTHLSVLDGRGGIAALTMSNGEGSGHVLGDTGVQINNFLGEEDLNPHGFHLHRPGTRMPTMMSPTVVRRGDAPILALGTGGANRIRTALAQTLYRVIAGDMSIEDAVPAPRFHAEGDEVWFETGGLGDVDATEVALRREFARVNRFEGRAFFFGGVHAVGRDRSGKLHGVGDTRRGGVAIVL